MFGFEGPWEEKKSGGNDAVGTPVPIPNTEVKHRNADDSWTETSCENMSLPDTIWRASR
mgnify:CR=1 FL=1